MTVLSSLIGILGRGSLGRFFLGAGGHTPSGPTMSLGMTYAAMIQLLSAKNLYMSTWSIGLYALPTAFSPTRVLSDYNSGPNVPSFSGYAVQTLGPWSAAFLDSLNRVVTTAPLVIWTPSNTLNPGPVAGFFIYDAVGRLVGAQANQLGPVTVGANLNPYTVAPFFQEQAIP